MKLALLNAKYQKCGTTGRNAHVIQFVSNVVSLGHEVWMDEDFQHPLARALSRDSLLESLHFMEAVYVRVAGPFPEVCRQVAIRKSHHQFQGPVVWEFNVAPDYSLIKGASDTEIQRDIALYRRYGSSCDLAVCVSESLAHFVREELGLNSVVTIPNGSDPEMFHPGVLPVRDIQTGPEVLNVAWLGSAHLPWHNLELVLQTARLLWVRNSGDRIAFHILGGGLDEVHELPPNVSYHGPIAYDSLPQWLSAMDVGLALYHPGPADFNSPLKMYDYMASSLAVIASMHPQMSDVLAECGQADSVLAGDEPEELVAKLLEWSRNRDKVSDQGRLARQLVVDKYNWRQSISAALEAIERRVKDMHNGRNPSRSTTGALS